MEDQSQSEGTMEYLLQAVISRAKTAFLASRSSVYFATFFITDEPVVRICH